MAVSSFPMVFSSAIGQYTMRMLYHGLPGVLSTTVVNCFHGSKQ